MKTVKLLVTDKDVANGRLGSTTCSIAQAAEEANLLNAYVTYSDNDPDREIPWIRWTEVEVIDGTEYIYQNRGVLTPAATAMALIRRNDTGRKAPEKVPAGGHVLFIDDIKRKKVSPKPTPRADRPTTPSRKAKPAKAAKYRLVDARFCS